MKLTIGMACYDDFDGVAFSLQSLGLHHDLEDVELLVIDNRPASDHGRATAAFCSHLVGRRSGPCRYIPMAIKTGTSQTRQRIFDEAQGQAVLVMDCHVLFPAGAIDRLKRFYAAHPDSRDIYSGPLILNSLHNWHTHFNDQWRGAMWGTWGSAWRCTCAAPLLFTTLEVAEQVHYRDLASSRTSVAGCGTCGRKLPAHDWAGHEQVLLAAGFQPLGFADGDEPFEIPGQGLGVFTCLKGAWPGFNEHFRGFGGEELYIHEKFRQRGGKAICLPWLKWWHRFDRPHQAPYPLRLWDKVRNYVLGHRELGLDLAPVYEHFVSLDTGGEDLVSHLRQVHGATSEQVQGKSPRELEALHGSYKLPEEQWNFLIADPEGRKQSPADVQRAVSFQTGRPQPPEGATLEQIYEWCRSVPRDLDQHLAKLRELSQQCEHVTEITKRRESTVALAAGRPKRLVSYTSEHDLLLKTLSEAIVADAKGAGPRRIETHTTDWHADWYQSGPLLEPIEETDLLFLDTVMTADHLARELAVHVPHVRRYLVVTGTGAFGLRAEGNTGPGLAEPLAQLLATDPRWSVIYHTDDEYGLTVLSCQDRDKPPRPIHAWPPGYGPGTEFKRMTSEELSITMPDNCTCRALANQMDKWGPEGCREHLEQIVAQVKANQQLWGWDEALANFTRAAWGSITSGLILKIDLTDPIPGLVQEAIRRAEAKEQAGETRSAA